MHPPLLRIETGGHAASTRAMAIDAAGRVLVTASHDQTARIWSLPDFRALGVFRPPISGTDDGKLTAVAVSPDGTLAAVAGLIGHAGDWAILIFDIATRQVVQRLDGLPTSGLALGFSRDGRHLAAGMAGASGLRVWTTSGWTSIWADPEYHRDVYGLSYDPSGRLAAASLDGSLRLYADGQRVASATAMPGRQPHHVAFNPDGTLLAVGYADAAKVDVRDGRTLALAWQPATDELTSGALPFVAWSGTGETLFAPWNVRRDGPGQVFGWDASGRGKRRVAAHGSPDGTFAFAALPAGGLVLVSSRGALALVGADARTSRTLAVAVQDLDTSKSLDHVTRRFPLSADGSRVAWVANDQPDHWLRFDVTHLDLASSPSRPPGLADWSASAGGLDVPASAWDDALDFRLARRTIPLDRNEHSRSISVREGRVLVGADRSLRLFDQTGRQLGRAFVPDIAWRVNQSGDGRIAVAAFDDGTVRWYRLPDLVELLTLFVAADGRRWVAWTPNGYYTAGIGGEDLIGWQVDRGRDQAADFFSVSRFREQFYPPDIITRVLATLDESEAIRLANEQRSGPTPRPAPITQDLPPVVQIRSPGDGAHVGAEATIVYSVRSPSGKPVRRVHVRINDHAAPGVRELVREELPQADGEAVSRVIVPMPPGGPVKLSLIAETDTKASEPATVQLVSTTVVAQGVRGNLYALVIGPTYGSEELRGVEFAGRDAREVASLLRVQKGGVLYDDVQVQVLDDSNAYRDAIWRGMDWLIRQTTQGDTAMLFLAGHGWNDERDHFWFLPFGADIQHLDSTAIDGDRIKDKLSLLPAKVVVFVDTCHAGNMLRFRAPDQAMLANKWSEPISGLMAFVASTGGERSQELSALKHGAFTAALLEGMRGAAAKLGNDLITVDELQGYITKKVQQLTGGYQHAALQRPHATPDFALFTRATTAGISQ